MIDKKNFFIASRGIWRQVRKADCIEDADYVSYINGKPSSWYRYTDAGVYRTSDHWRTVGACHWSISIDYSLLNGEVDERRCLVLTDMEGKPAFITGFIEWQELDWTNLRILTAQQLKSAAKYAKEAGVLQELVRAISRECPVRLPEIL